MATNTNNEFTGRPTAPTSVTGQPVSTDQTVAGTSGMTQVQIEAEIQRRAANLANQMMAAQAAQQQTAANGRIFTRFDLSSDVVTNQKVKVTSGLFSNSAGSLSYMYTSSLQSTTSKQYYYEVWDSNSDTAEAQFSIAYGHRLGSGSSGNGTDNDSPSRAVYSQYKQILLNPGDTAFTFLGGYTTNNDSIYVVNFNRARIKEKLDPGNWQLNIGELSGSFIVNSAHTGSNVKMAGTGKIIKLIDDSGDTNQTSLTSTNRVFNIVSGSINNGVYSPGGSTTYYGLVYPDLGILVLNGSALDLGNGFNTVTGSNIAGDNAWKLYTAISGAMVDNRTDNAFTARNEETVSSTHYFVRAKNAEYNFSNNPSFTTGSVGEFKQPTFIEDPKVYMTTIGLYNDRQELLAVAKLSQPVQKSFSTETLVKVKLDF